VVYTKPIREETWISSHGGPVKPDLVIYATVDGGFSVWDSARNYGKDLTTGKISPHESPKTYEFSPDSLANGLKDGDRTLCNGLIRDWVEWYYERSSASRSNTFQHLEDVIALFSHPEESVACVEPRRVFIDDIRKFPTLTMPYGAVPFPHWSAGMRRVVSLAYLMVWAWVEHLLAVELRHEEPSKRLVLIVDEVESHLHPRWQRTILPALLRVAEKLRADLEVQFLVATHSPIVLASIEPHFEEKRDKLFWFDLQDGKVTFRESPWAMQGDIVGWLTSEIFGLRQARSKEAEIAIEAAEAFMREDLDELPEELKTKEKIHRALKKSLPGLDPFWPRWIVKVKP